MKKISQQQIRFMCNRNTQGIIIKNRKKVFRPLLANGIKQSAILENNDIYIPLNRGKTEVIKTVKHEARIHKGISNSINHENKYNAAIGDLKIGNHFTVDNEEPRKPKLNASQNTKQKLLPFTCTSYNYLSNIGSRKHDNIMDTYMIHSPETNVKFKSNRPIKTRGEAKSTSELFPMISPEKPIYVSEKINPFEAYEVKRPKIKTKASKRQRNCPISLDPQNHGNLLLENPKQNSQIKGESALTDDEKKIYGNRFPNGFQKIKLLGRYFYTKCVKNEKEEVVR